MTGLDEHTAPDSAFVTIGWRAWNIKRVQGSSRLVSPSFPIVWPVDEPLEAYHRSEHTCKGDSCNCGVNAARRADYVAQEGYLKLRGGVLGEVALWGQVRYFEDGWRGDKAYPHRLWAASRWSSRTAKQVADVYGCEYGGAIRIRTDGALWMWLHLVRVAAHLGQRFMNMNVLVIVMGAGMIIGMSSSLYSELHPGHAPALLIVMLPYLSMLLLMLIMACNMAGSALLKRYKQHWRIEFLPQ